MQPWLRVTVALCVSLAEGRAHAQDRFAGTPFANARVEVIGRELAVGVFLDVHLARDGSLLLVDGTDKSVRRVNRDGTLRYSIGRSGAGPGEFGSPQRIAELTNGTVLVYDLATRRFSQFSPSGAFLKRWTTSVDLKQVKSLVPLPDAGFAVSGMVADLKAGQHAIHVFDSTFRLVRSFGHLPVAKSRRLLETFGSEMLSVTSDGDLLYSRQIPYELSLFTANGHLKRRFTVARRVSQAVDEVYNVRQDGERIITRRSKDGRYAFRAARLPDGLIITGRGGGELTWDVLDAQGAVVWSGPPPAGIDGYIGADPEGRFLWFIGEDDDEPVLFRVVPAGTSPRGGAK